jgi:hypothetical protein
VPVLIAPFLLEYVKFGYTLAEVRQRYGPYRTGSGATSTEGAAILPVLDDPGKVVIT